MKILLLAKQKSSKEKGFSLIEVVFAIGIITVGLISILSLFIHNIRTEINSKNKLIAIYLANESIEIVRQTRDNNWFNNRDWMFQVSEGGAIVGLVDKTDIRKGWEIETSNVNRKKVYLSDNSYVQCKTSPVAADGWVETNFERYLTITENSGGAIAGCLGVTDCMEITSHISLNGTRIVEVTAYLYDGWY